MAEKIIVELDVKTSDAINNVDNLGKSFEDVYGDIKPLTTRVGELEDRLYEMAQAGDTASDEFKNLTREAGRLKTAQKEVDEIMDRSSRTLSEKVSTGLNTVASGAVLASSTMSEFGIIGEDSAKIVNRGIAAISFVQFFTSLNESFGLFTKIGNAIKSLTIFQKASTAAQWLWNTAMNANPIGAITIAITALITAGYALITMFNDSTSASDKNTAAIKRQTDALNEQTSGRNRDLSNQEKKLKRELEIAKAKGKSDKELRELEIKGNKELLKSANRLRDLTNEELKKANNEVKKLKGEERKAKEEHIAKLNTILLDNQAQEQKYIDEGKAIQHRAELDELNSTRETAEEKARIQAEAREKAREKAREANKDIVEVEVDDNGDPILETVDIEEEDPEDVALLKAGERLIEKKKLADEEIALEAAKTAAKQKGLSDLVSIFGAESAIGKAALIGKQLMAAQELLIDLGAIKSKATKAIVGAQLNAAESGGAVATGLSKTLALGFPAAIPALLGYVSAAAGIVAGVKAATSKTKDVASQYGGSFGGSGVSLEVPTIPAVASIPPAFNVVGSSDTNQLADAIGGQSSQPVRAYVVSGEVSTAQSLDRNIIDDASIG